MQHSMNGKTWVDVTFDFEFGSHFKDHKQKCWQIFVLTNLIISALAHFE